MCRSVLSGGCGFAARRGVLDRNPVRNVGTISTKPKNPRTLTIAQAQELRMRLGYDDRAIRRDIPDFVGFMPASGLRIGECAAILWKDIDFDAWTTQINGCGGHLGSHRGPVTPRASFS
jgi:integrase